MVKESSVQIEEKYPELGKLIQTGRERGFIMYEELYDNLPEEVTGIAEELDDVTLRFWAACGVFQAEIMAGAADGARGALDQEAVRHAKSMQWKSGPDGPLFVPSAPRAGNPPR